MTVWKPAKNIRVKVIGLVWNGPRLLAAEVETSAGTIKGVRPLGGSVEFGETREQALHREFREELECSIFIQSDWQTFENIYEHEGAVGHEIVFAVKISLLDVSFYQREKINFAEADGVACVARWFDLNALSANGLELYPTGLRSFIDGQMQALPCLLCP